MRYIKQSTATAILIGPFLSDSDGKTPQTSLTVASIDVDWYKQSDTHPLTKTDITPAASASSNDMAHVANGWYSLELTTANTDTVGRCVITANISGALPVWHKFMVLPTLVYDSLILGSDKLQVHADEITNGLITAAAIATNAIDDDALAADAVTAIQAGIATAASIAALNNLSAAQVNAEADTAIVDAALATAANLAILATYVDTEIATLVSNVAAILADTGTDGVALSTAAKQSIADEVLKRSVSNVEDTAGLHSITELILAILEGSTVTGSWVSKKTDGVTTFNTRTLVTDPDAEPIVGVS